MRTHFTKWSADVPKKYSHIDFRPPQVVADAASRGLSLRQKASPSNRGGLTPAEAGKAGVGSGVQRAVNLKNRDSLSPDTVRQMVRFFSRHEKNKSLDAENKNTPWEDKGYVAWLLWGGDPGRKWAEKIVAQMDVADKARKEAFWRVRLGHVVDAWLSPGKVHMAAGKYKQKKKVETKDGDEAIVYVYSERQVQNRNREKAERYESLSKDIKKLRAQVSKDLDSDDQKTRLTALAVCLIDAVFERVGNDDSAEEGHFGVTGWLKKHLTFGKGKVTIRYIGKSGVKHEKVVDDSKLVKALKDCCEDKKPDDPILSFGEDDVEGSVKITSRDVNTYLKPFDVTAKDLRGYHANREMQEQLRSIRKKGPKLPADRKAKDKILKAEFKRALEATAEAVGHEATTLRTQYLVPGLEDTFMKDGTVMERLKSAAQRVASLWLHIATKSDAEREEEETERLIRPSPKKKPPRRDSRRNRIQTKDDDPPKRDRDLSMNYKDVGG